ncbi:F-box associated interaction domain [Arabidopsis suecica]|uniref:F-box associated interaction domain n=1 Tax=Arabidopsis suecica TaxID=45249 RepID=A0A8T2HEU5_ARASU|nr:F-box associated interaction domain [Arabidopsis suecica]
MNGGEKLESVPIDLIIEINSRLPAESVARSRARPRLLFVLQHNRKWSFSVSSSPQNQNIYVKPSFVVADFHMKFSVSTFPDFHSCSGLIHFSMMKGAYTVPVVCNSRTGQYAVLPKLTRTRYENSYSFVGYDPIEKQIKVLFMSDPDSGDDHRILTLGTTEKMLGRKIECSLTHNILSNEGVCINGVLYYKASRIVESSSDDDTSDDDHDDHERSDVIVCFDFRCEKFEFIDICFYGQLINCNGKLGGATWKFDGNTVKLCMWILEDVEKHEWSKHVYNIGDLAEFNPKNHVILGVIATGEIVFSMRFTSKPFYVLYFDPETNTFKSVEIQGLENDSRVYGFVDLIEDLNVIDTMQLISSSATKGQNTIWQSLKQKHRQQLHLATSRQRSESILRYEYGLLV